MKARFAVGAPLARGEAVSIMGAEFHHASHVVRLAVGEEIELFDPRGRCARATVQSIGPLAIVASVDELIESREPSLRVTLAAALIQPEKFELVLQKGTELGVAVFVPLLTERTEVREERIAGKQARWEKIVLEAVKQSGRSVVPSIEPPASLDSVLGRKGEKVIFEAERPSTFEPGGSDLMLLTGPEGGWSEAEIERAIAAGASCQRLGPRRLRAETASIAATVFVMNRCGDLR